MSHRGICPYCGKVIWMGQPVRPWMAGCLHEDCAEEYERDCWRELHRGPRFVTHDMAIDAGMPELEGSRL